MRGLKIDIIVRDTKGGRVYRKKNAPIDRTLKELDEFLKKKYTQPGTPHILKEHPPEWMVG